MKCWDKNEHAACKRKRSYMSRASARRQCRELKKRSKRPGRRFGVYLCRHCGLYHIGTQQLKYDK